MAQANILVVDDEQDIRDLVCEILEDEGYGVVTAESGETARAAFAQDTPDLVLLDIWMPDVDGISLLKEWSGSGRLACPVVMISGHGTLETAVEATRLGARDFVQKPISLARLLATVKNALAAGGGAPAVDRARPTAPPPQGGSPQMQLLRRTAAQAAAAEAPILLTGEPGSGKEALAAWLHQQSGRSGPLTVLDRLRLTPDEARAYLVGKAEEPGVLEHAAAGTVYIPELQELEPEVQALLAAIVEGNAFTPLGARDARSLECRLVAGLSGDPEQAVQAGDLDKNLHLLLGVLPLHLPPLRERPEDVPELVSHHADRLSNAEGLDYRHFSVSALNRLRNHEWPGNERELVNLVKRLLVLGGEGEVTAREVEDALRKPGAETSPASAARPGSFDLPLREAREAFEREYLIYQLRKAGGSVGKLSDAVGMERTHLYRKLRSLGIDPKKVAGDRR